MSKLILFLVVVLLITLVLFLSYKMDKNEISKKRKEKIIKNNSKKEDIDKDIYNGIQDMVRASISEIEKDNKSALNQDTMQINTEDIKEQILNDYIEDKTEEINIEDKVLSNYIDILDEDDLDDIELEDNINQEEIKKSEEYEDKKEVYNNIENENLDEFTMVFNSKLLKSTEKILEENDDDLGLEDLEKEIAVANIKKYTRSKKETQKLVSKKEISEHKENNNVKRYTRKKTNNKKIQEDKEIKVKRYTRKKIINEDLKVNYEEPNNEESTSEETENIERIREINEVPKFEKPKLKRGRPRKADTPKRGRPKKVVTPKRGRPKKEEKPKRGRPKKTENSSQKKKITKNKE